jgi:hypothetical protein
MTWRRTNGFEQKPDPAFDELERELTYHPPKTEEVGFSYSGSMPGPNDAKILADPQYQEKVRRLHQKYHFTNSGDVDDRLARGLSNSR